MRTFKKRRICAAVEIIFKAKFKVEMRRTEKHITQTSKQDWMILMQLNFIRIRSNSTSARASAWFMNKSITLPGPAYNVLS